jgi:hypothetical protein
MHLVYNVLLRVLKLDEDTRDADSRISDMVVEGSKETVSRGSGGVQRLAPTLGPP